MEDQAEGIARLRSPQDLKTPPLNRVRVQAYPPIQMVSRVHDFDKIYGDPFFGIGRIAFHDEAKLEQFPFGQHRMDLPPPEPVLLIPDMELRIRIPILSLSIGAQSGPFPPV